MKNGIKKKVKNMKPSRERFEAYAAGIDKALRRAAKRAALTAAATGTRLIIYDKDRIKRLRPFEVRNLPGVTSKRRIVRPQHQQAKGQ